MPKECINVHLSKTLILLDMPTILALNEKSLLVFSYIETKLQREEYTTIQLKSLYEVLPISMRTVQECLYRLRDVGLIDIISGTGYANKYRLGPTVTNLNQAEP